MTTAVLLPTTHTEAPAQPVVAVRRRTVDRVLIALGGVAAIVLAVAGGLLRVGIELRRRLRPPRAVVAEHRVPQR